MNLEDLRAAQDDERRSDSLQPLPDSFYRDVAGYVADLREERERAAASADDPFGSGAVRQLTDEIETAEEVVEAIYERRVGKVVKRASLAAAGMPTDDEGLTTEEAALFEELVGLIEANRREVLDVIAGGTGTGADAHTAAEPDATTVGSEPVGDSGPGSADAPAFDAGEAMGGEPPADSSTPETDGGPADGPEPSGGPAGDSARAEDADGVAQADDVAETDDDTDVETGRVTVRITRDVGEVFGVDERVYELAAEDVVSLPEENARPLLERDAAQHLF